MKCTGTQGPNPAYGDLLSESESFTSKCRVPTRRKVICESSSLLLETKY